MWRKRLELCEDNALGWFCVNFMDEWIVCADAARWGGLRNLGAQSGYGFAGDDALEWFE